MAAAGIQSCEANVFADVQKINTTRRCINMALDMMTYASNVSFDGVPLTIKIGVHKGRVIAGVIGYHKP